MKSKLHTSSAEIFSAISTLVSCSTHTDVAVAFWGTGACEALSFPRDGHAQKTRVVCNLESGATNPAEVRSLLKAKVAVKSHAQLHAKIWIGDDRIVMGSANASANGLGLEGAELTQWLELCQESPDETLRAAAAAWFEDLWKRSRDITPALLTEAERLWRIRRAQRPVLRNGFKSRDLISAARSDLEQFKDRPLFVILDSEHMDPEAKSIEKQERRATKLKIEAWQDWAAMPPGATLIAWWWEKERPYWEKFFRTPQPPMTREVRKGSKLTFAKVVDDAEGLSLGDRSEWKRAIKREIDVRRPGYHKRGGTEWCIPFYDFAATHFKRDDI